MSGNIVGCTSILSVLLNLGCARVLGADFDNLPPFVDAAPEDRREKDRTEPPDVQVGEEPVDGGQEESATDGAEGPDAGCSDPCEEEGSFSCGSVNQAKFCRANGACLQWSVLPCSNGSLCCDGSCVRADEANCFACGRACTGSTPVCSAVAQTCTCTVGICAATGEQCDDATRRCVDKDDYYVDASVSAGGDGSAQHPYRTITAALAIAAGRAKRIHVGPGTYNVALGESFPLIVRGASILGADAATTIVQGLGYFDLAAAGGGLGVIVETAFVMGDVKAITNVSNLTFRAPTGMVRDTAGLLCDRGTASPALESATPPNTIIDGVTIEGFGVGIEDTYSTQPRSGCNLKLTSSSIRLGVAGVFAYGCDLASEVPTSLEIGGDTEGSGNLFESLRAWPSGLGGAGVGLYDCVTHVTVRNNTFRNSAIGLSVTQLRIPPRNTFTVTNNKFQDLTDYGVGIFGATAIVRDLSGNIFTNISGVMKGALAFGLLLDPLDDPTVPVVKVRGNQFIGNDVGVEFRSSGTAFSEGLEVSDFGTVSDPGRNVFSCNSTSIASMPGADVRFAIASDSGVTLPFSGNFWDHAPPTRASTDADGVDVVMVSSQSPGMDMSASSVAANACPTGKKP